MKRTIWFRPRNSSGMTLLELLIGLGVASIFTGVVVFMLSAGMDAFFYSQDELFLDRTIDTVLSEISDGGFDNYGVRDALKMVYADTENIEFVPLYVDTGHMTDTLHGKKVSLGEAPFRLKYPVRSGASHPLAEVYRPGPRGEKRWQTVPITYIPGKRRDIPGKVYLKEKIGAGIPVRFLYHPVSGASVKIGFKDGKIERSYEKISDIIPRHSVPGVGIDGLEFEYYDNRNVPIFPANERLKDITAVKVRVSAFIRSGSDLREKTKSKSGITFVNLRNTRTGGAGVIIEQGSRVSIPDSREVRVLAISNISGPKEDGVISLRLVSDEGLSWKIVISLSVKNDEPVISGYRIMYPSGDEVFSQRTELPLKIPFDLLELGPDGKYGYSYRENRENYVDIRGNVEMIVEQMDAEGATLLVRP